MKKYIKNSNQINTDKIEFPRLPQSKSYLKIISLPYFMNNTNMPIKADVVKIILKNNNNISLAS